MKNLVQAQEDVLSRITEELEKRGHTVNHKTRWGWSEFVIDDGKTKIDINPETTGTLKVTIAGVRDSESYSSVLPKVTIRLNKLGNFRKIADAMVVRAQTEKEVRERHEQHQRELATWDTARARVLQTFPEHAANIKATKTGLQLSFEVNEVEAMNVFGMLKEIRS